MGRPCLRSWESAGMSEVWGRVGSKTRQVGQVEFRMPNTQLSPQPRTLNPWLSSDYHPKSPSQRGPSWPPYVGCPAAHFIPLLFALVFSPQPSSLTLHILHFGKTARDIHPCCPRLPPKVMCILDTVGAR